jgi:feruloyl esterase
MTIRGNVSSGLLALMITSAPFAWAQESNLIDPPVVRPGMECERLTFADFSTLPEAPTRILSADLVTETAPAPYCRVTGYVAPQVGFELHLPTMNWTQRLVFAGCGGLCGSIRMGVSQANGCAPIDEGTAATVASNLGHQGAGLDDGIWAAGDPQARIDFAYRGVHVVAVASKAIIAAFYGQEPRHSYFVGCSDGGREGMMSAQRYPEDFDGITAGAPAFNFVIQNTFYHSWNAMANRGPNGKAVLESGRVPLLHEAVLAACDGIDGLNDRVIDDPRLCTFDVASATCAEGADPATCFAPAEAEVARRIYEGPRDETGRRLTISGAMPGSEAAWPGVNTADDPDRPPFAVAIALGFLRHLAWWDDPAPDYDLADLAFDAATFESLKPTGQVLAAMNPDLRPFAEAGGKLILWHGSADQHIAPTNTLAYRAALRETVGEELADTFTRTFMIPGMYHCQGGSGPSEMDVVSAMMHWVEKGVAPDSLLTSRTIDGAVVASRPVFNYPLISKWDGVGDPAMAGSYYSAQPAMPADETYEWAGKELFTSEGQAWCRQDGLSLTCEVELGPSQTGRR